MRNFGYWSFLMANLKVTLVRVCKTENGWGRWPAAFHRNGRLHHNFIQIKKQEKGPYPEGHYELRFYEGLKTQYRPVGGDPTEARSALDQEIRVRALRLDARAAGIELVDDRNARLDLWAQERKFLKRQEDRGHERAAETAKIAIDDFLEITGHKYADEITEDSILLYYRKLRARGNEPRTIYNKHVSLFGFFRWLKIDTKALAEAPPSFTERTVIIYHPDELQRLFAACTPYQRLILTVLLNTGLRMQEAMYLRWPDIDFSYKKIHVLERASLDKSIKDRAERMVPCPTELLDMLKEWREKHPKTKYVLGTANDTPNWKMLQMLKRLARTSELNCGDCDGCSSKANECRHWSIKRFRATYTTMLLRDGYDVRTVMEYTGHKDLETVLKYLAVAHQMSGRIDSVAFMGEASRLPG
jgi:integrase/recombinase XerD